MATDEERAVAPPVPPPEAGSAPAPSVSPPTPPTPAPVEPAPSEDWALRFKYLFADFENFRRRSERDREQARQEGRVSVLRHLLPLLESSEKASEAARTLPPKHPLRTGLDLLAQEWEAFRKAQHLETVARVGYPFRSEEQEALGEVNPTDEIPEGSVVEIIQQGYRCDAGLIRTAKVLVARSRPGSSEGLETPPANPPGE
jgi:molecular chaperone GrpE